MNTVLQRCLAVSVTAASLVISKASEPPSPGASPTFGRLQRRLVPTRGNATCKALNHGLADTMAVRQMGTRFVS